jgi:hypothetical protein
MSEKPNSNFIELCVREKARLEEIDDYVCRWHECDSRELHEFLGMEKQECALWTEEASALPFIVIAHAEKRSIGEVLEQFNHLTIAAQSHEDNAARLLESFCRLRE